MGHLLGLQARQGGRGWKQFMILFHYHYIKVYNILHIGLSGGLFKGITL